jgi:ketosteroid isomerase-like protein
MIPATKFIGTLRMGPLARIYMRISKYPLNGLAILCGFLMFVFSSAAGSNTAETAQNEIRATLEKWTNDFNAGNSSDVCAFFAPDLISSYQGQPEGDYHSLCVQLLTSLNDPIRTYHYSLQIKEILVCGDLAVARLVWLLRVTQKSVPGENFIDETSLDIFRRQPDGSWKIFRFNAYPSSSK